VKKPLWSLRAAGRRAPRLVAELAGWWWWGGNVAVGEERKKTAASSESSSNMRPRPGLSGLGRGGIAWAVFGRCFYCRRRKPSLPEKGT
jgi:hypothetical protein